MRNGSSLSRRRFLVALAVGMPAVALAACGAPAPGTVAVAPTAPAQVPSAPAQASTAAPAATPVASAATPAPAPAAASASPTPGPSVLVYGTTGDAQTLNPLLSTDTASSIVHARIFEGLVKIDPETGRPIPGLAERWDQSPDGLTYTFRMRRDVTWSDGVPLTAEDAKFTFDTIMDPKTKTVRRGDYDQVKTFDVVDPATFRVTLKEPYCPFLVNMTIGLVPRHVLASSPDVNTDEFNTKRPVGTGPYVLTEWKKDDHVTLTANPAYWGGAPKIRQWVMRVVKDTNVVFAQLKTGEIDVATIDASNMDEAQRQPNLAVTPYYSLGYTFIGYNEANPRFQDKRVRQALTHALDRDVLVQKVLYGQGQVINGPIPPISWAYAPDIPAFDYDVAAAKQLLGQAGWTPGPDGILQKDGKPFAFTLTTNSGGIRGAIATIAQDQLKKVGIKVETSVIEWNAFLDRVNKTHDFDAVVLAWSLGNDPDQKSTWATSSYPSGFNFIKYGNPQVDTLLDQARSVPGCDQATRKGLYAQIQKLIADDQPFTFLHMPKTVVAANKRIQGLRPSPWTNLFWNVQDLTVAP